MLATPCEYEYTFMKIRVNNGIKQQIDKSEVSMHVVNKQADIKLTYRILLYVVTFLASQTGNCIYVIECS